MSARLLFVSLAWMLTACGPDAGSAPSVTRDSVGIAIVENPAPDSTTPSFQVAETPFLTLGELDGPEAEQFGMVVGAMRNAAGEVVVADRSATELRVFDTTGALVRRIGRKGEGPGDFAEIAGLVEAQTGIHVWDWRLRRLSAFSETGEFLAGRQVDWLPKIDSTPMLTSPFPLRILADGRVIAAGRRGRFNPPSGNYRDSTGIWLIDSTGTMHQVGSHYREASYIYHTPEGNIWFGSTPFGPQGRMVPQNSGWITSDGTHFELRYSTLANVLTRIVRVQRAPAPVTDADRSWFIDSLLADYPAEDHDGERKAAEWAEWETTMPAYDALLQDSEGLVWARLYPYDADTASWDVFDAEGRLIATASTPAALDVKQIGPDWLLGQGKGELDEPLVYLYRMKRN